MRRKHKGKPRTPKAPGEILAPGEPVPAWPPLDYQGTMADWAVALQVAGVWDGEGDPGGLMIDQDTWWTVLEHAEGPPRPKKRHERHGKRKQP